MTMRKFIFLMLLIPLPVSAAPTWVNHKVSATFTTLLQQRYSSLYGTRVQVRIDKTDCSARGNRTYQCTIRYSLEKTHLKLRRYHFKTQALVRCRLSGCDLAPGQTYPTTMAENRE